MTQNVPQLMMRIWDGDPDEYFTASDMRRVEGNSNILARYAGIPETDFSPVTRASQFDYREAQKLENHIQAVGQALGLTVAIEPAWSYNRIITFADFDRWENGLFLSYQALGGVGDRIPSDKALYTVNALLKAGDWQGTGPFTQDLEVPAIRDGSEPSVWVSRSADVLQRADEFNARLQMIPAPQGVRIIATGLCPSHDIPIKILTRPWKMQTQITLSASGWTGPGPWTQTVDIGHEVRDAVVGSDERNSVSQVGALADAVVGVSAVSGTNVTMRAIGVKPVTDVYATVMWTEAA